MVCSVKSEFQGVLSYSTFLNVSIFLSSLLDWEYFMVCWYSISSTSATIKYEPHICPNNQIKTILLASLGFYRPLETVSNANDAYVSNTFQKFIPRILICHT